MDRATIEDRRSRTSVPEEAKIIRAKTSFLIFVIYPLFEPYSLNLLIITTLSRVVKNINNIGRAHKSDGKRGFVLPN